MRRWRRGREDRAAAVAEMRFAWVKVVRVGFAEALLG